MNVSYGVFKKARRGYTQEFSKSYDTPLEMELTEPVPEGLKTWVLIVIIAGAAIVFLSMVLVICCCCKKKVPDDRLKLHPTTELSSGQN